MKTVKILVVFLCTLVNINVNAQGLKAFKLPNGLSVFVWEDKNVPDIFGMIAVNVGSKEEPAEYTGLAHYLEHLMFMGTDKIGTLDWEKEKPVYEQIIAKYDELALATESAKKDGVLKEINQLTNEAAKFNKSVEFSNLVQGIGGKYLNAATSFDYTVYFNIFPPREIFKWLQLYADRLVNPVFRNFQHELENVYEEYNRGQDESGSREAEFILKTLFGGHPYERSIIGLPEHLKNPQLSQLNQFYTDWYVPGNMALILIGNIETNEIVPMVRETLGKLENRPTPERKTYPEMPLKGRKEVSAKVSLYPHVILAFPGITATNDEDDIALEICAEILSNSNRTGLIDKLVIDGDLNGTDAELLSLKERGYVIVTAVPYYDVNQRRFESLKSTEKIILKEIQKLQEGKVDEWRVQSIKSNMIRNFDLMMEAGFDRSGRDHRAIAINELFINGKDVGRFLNYKDIVSSITVEEIKATAKKYFSNNYFALHMEKGKPGKTQNLEKPNLAPIDPVHNAESDYAKMFRLLPVKHSTPQYGNMNDVIIKNVNDRSKLYYTHNPENDIFTLTLKFGIGTEKMPKLEWAAQLMNNAGILGAMEAQEVKQEFSNLGATCRYYVDDSYLYVVMNGFEANLKESCNLMTRQILLPKLDEKQMNSLKGASFQEREIEKDAAEILANAMREYLLYKDKSQYINRLSLEDILEFTISNLTGEFQRATDYEAQIHYTGSLPIDDVYTILSQNLPLKQGEKASVSPEIKDRVSYKENTIFFLPNSDAKQSSIFFFIEGDEFAKDKTPYTTAFNQYFDGSFNGLVMQEIREYRSMAYTASGNYQIPSLENKKGCFLGYIGTQADKTLDALAVYTDLLTNMPQYPERIDNIKSFLQGTAAIEKPPYRAASQVYEAWKLRGFNQSPAETYKDVIDQLTFDEIVRFYDENIKGRPIAIGIVGNPKMIDEKALSTYGKLIKLSNSKVFKDK